MRRTTTTAIALAAAVTVMVPLAPSAQAKGREVIRTGSCSGGSDWKLKVKQDDGRLEVQWEVDSNRSGQVWRVRIRDNGVRVVATRAVTRPPSGSFDVERRIADRPGTDLVVARSRHLGEGEVCRGVVRF